MKQKQILMTKHMLCLCCVVMTLLNDGDTEQRAQAIQCALSFEALSRRTTKLTKILSAKINKTKRNEKLSTSTSTTSSLSPSILIALSDTTSSVPTHTHTHTHTYIQAYLSYMVELHTCMSIRSDIYVCLHVCYIVLLAALFLRSLWPFLSKASSNFLFYF